MKKSVTIFVVCIQTPLHVGIYQDNLLVKTYTSEQKTSEALPNIMQEILSTCNVEKLLFVKGPGSFMAIKASYIFLKTLSITLNIPLLACNGFAVNGNTPIHAFGKLFFIQENGKILTKIVDEKSIKSMALPENIATIQFDANNEPLYVLPAV